MKKALRFSLFFVAFMLAIGFLIKEYFPRGKSNIELEETSCFGDINKLLTLYYTDNFAERIESELKYKLEDKKEARWNHRTFLAYLFDCSKSEFLQRKSLILTESTNDDEEHYIDLLEDFFIEPLYFEDMNRDGLLEIVVNSGTGGNCWTCLNKQVLQIEDEELLDLTANLNQESVSSVKEIKDLNNDNIPELLVLDARWEFFWNLCHVCSPQVERVYVWERDKYVESSENFREVFLSKIKVEKKNLEELYGNEDMIEGAFGRAITMLLDYEIIGEKEKGWEEFLEMTKLSNWPNLSEAHVKRFEELKSFLREQYESNEPFSPKK